MYIKKALLAVFCLFTISNTYAQLSEQVGIGARMRLDSSRGYSVPVVIETVTGAPARTAGLLPEDVILKVNDRSTRDLLLKDVVAAIVGEENTEVKLVIERKGTTRNFTIMRKKYKYASAYYTSEVKDDAFCTALLKLMNDAAYDFENTIDTNHFKDIGKGFARRYFDCKVNVPGAEKVSIVSSFGNTAQIIFGNFATPAEVSAAGQPIIAQIKNCFPDYYMHPVVDKDGTVNVQIGRTFKDGYESPILEFTYYKNDEANAYTMIMNVSGGKQKRFREIATRAQTNSYAKALRTIFNDIPNDYRNVKGERHQEGSGGAFSSPTVWYDIVPKPDGARDCFLQEGGMFSSANGCNCRFFLGADGKAAAQAFLDVLDSTIVALGSEFVYTGDREQLDMTIPTDAKAAITFGIKKSRSYESLPLVTLVLLQYEDKRYAVNMLFHKFGF